MSHSTSPRKSIRQEGHGALPSHGHGANVGETHGSNIDSLSYALEDSDAWRAHLAAEHYNHRGKFWNEGKHATMVRYVLIAVVAIVQASIAYFTNILSTYFINSKFGSVYALLEQGHTFSAFLWYLTVQTFFAMLASMFIWIEPVAAGSGIPEVKCYLNGIDIERVASPMTLVAKVLGVICSVSAGLPVGKEGPMVHSGAVVAATLSSRRTRNDREKRDFVACGTAAGVCTAFSAPIGGILFALEEGASYWAPSLTWRTFYCSMLAFTSLLMWDTVGSSLGSVGFNKLFSFGNWTFEGTESIFAVYELFLFMLIGAVGGLIGAIFNNTNEAITHWRKEHVNHSKQRRFLEVVLISILVSIVSFALPLLWTKCTPLPDVESLDEQQRALVEELVPFCCIPGEEYNELASLIFTEAGSAIRQLFHLHSHTFSDTVLFAFFLSYISLAVVVYGIAVPSGLFVPSLLSGAAFGRLVGNLALKIHPHLAFSNTYALIGAAAVLGGMARMTISLTVILLECTGNEQFVLPLMLTLMTARLVGNLFNDDLYHIHIHMKKGVQFLEAELRTNSRHHE
jgi:chloride channel 7